MAHVRLSSKTVGGGLAIGAGLAALGYAGLVAYHRLRYGQEMMAVNDDSLLLDRFIPKPEVVEHHRVRIAAPADIVMSTARSLELLDSRMIRTIFKLRELALGGQPDERRHPAALLPQMQSIGWVVLAERAGREIVLGAVTRPWEASPVFRSVPAGEFAAFREPGYVKIAWTIRADPAGQNESTFHTETRVATTDEETRKRFQTYWSFVAPGVELIRLAMLRPLKKAAEKSAARAAA
ncbi:MAG: hypothetical protein AB7P34_11020 [Vicinamibacterales bacterium]